MSTEKFTPATPPVYTQYMSSHIHGGTAHLRNDSEQLRQKSPEQILFHQYEEASSPHGPALYAVKGEHWNGVCPAFLDFINNFKFKREDMGYSECGYGIQRHRDFMRKLIIAEHHLEKRQAHPDLEIDVGCLSMTTRMAMYDLAKVAYRESRLKYPNKSPVALVPTPSWDYRGIFKDVGFEVVFLPIKPDSGWLPNLTEWSEIIKDVEHSNDSHVALAVSNPQHNPTGMQWPGEVTKFLLKLCARNLGYLLLDDAYYNVHDPRTPLVNGLKTLLDAFDENDGNNELSRSGQFERWVATRPFGKQFSCNTMGVAAITTSPKLLAQLGRESWINRYHCNTHNAEIMCNWLSQPEAADWTLETGLRYTRQKERVKQKLMDDMGWSQENICVGPSTSYMLIEIPKVYQVSSGGIDRFRDDLFYATGTLVSASLFNQTARVPFVRLHVGSHPDVIEEFMRRWYAAGLNFNQTDMFPGKDSLNSPIEKLKFRQQKLE